MFHDVIVIGGSFAGLAAALQIARARRNVLVIDAGLRRNRFADSSHGFLGQDGRAPGEIIADARRQLLAYPTAALTEGTVVGASRIDNGFAVTLDNGDDLTAKRLVLASGVVDALPSISGLEERWGKSVFHCPYCHGYELDNGRIGILATSELSMHQAILIADWGKVTLFVNGTFEPDAEQMASLSARGVSVERSRVAELSGHADVKLADGRTIPFDGLFTVSRTSMASPVPEQLGCKFAEGPLGNHIETSGLMETSVAGVFACGDAAKAMGSVSIAVADGAIAGVGAHQSLIFQ
jgi:thioredoxin reductase